VVRGCKVGECACADASVAPLTDELDGLVAILGDDVADIAHDGAGWCTCVVTVRHVGRAVARLRCAMSSCPALMLRVVDVEGVAATGAQRRDCLAAAALAVAEAASAAASCDSAADLYTQVLAASSAVSACVSGLVADAREEKHGDVGEIRWESAVAVLRIDHMRRERAYLSTMRRLAADAGVCCTVGFAGHLIVLVVEACVRVPAGRAHASTESPAVAAVDAYLRAHRTTTIDVDAGGRACTEK